MKLDVSPLFSHTAVTLVPDSAYHAFVNRLARTARTRLWCSQFVIDGRSAIDPEQRVLGLCHALAEAHHRGVDVRLVHDDLRPELGGPELNLAARRFLAARGVPVRVFGGFDPALAMGRKKRMTQSRRHSLHAKMVLCDDSVALVGNHNWTPGAFGDHRELSLAVRGADALAWLGRYYTSIWKRAAQCR